MTTTLLTAVAVPLPSVKVRRVPKDPFTNTFEWGLRSWQDEPTSTSWGGQNVFDVYTKSPEKAPDGTPYAQW